MHDELKNVLYYLITAWKFIKAKTFNSGLFAKLCKESCSEFQILVLHLQLTRLSRRKSIKKVFHVLKVNIFLQDAKLDLCAEFCDVF